VQRGKKVDIKQKEQRLGAEKVLYGRLDNINRMNISEKQKTV